MAHRYCLRFIALSDDLDWACGRMCTRCSFLPEYYLCGDISVIVSELHYELQKTFIMKVVNEMKRAGLHGSLVSHFKFYLH